MKTLIGIGHYSRTGKDTLAKAIVNQCANRNPSLKVRKYSFAGKLKEVAHYLYAWAGLQDGPFYETEEGARLRDVPLQIGLTPVEVWIGVGNKLREVYRATWVHPVIFDFINDDSDVGIITDVRFPDEITAVENIRSHFLIKTVRPGVSPRDSVSDRALLDCDRWDYWAGPTLDDLDRLACDIAEWLVYGGPRPTQTPESKTALVSSEFSYGMLQ